MTADEGMVRFKIDGDIGTLTLDRPQKLNAITPVMLDQLEAIASEADASRSLRCLVLHAVGERAFSVGADIEAWTALEPLDMWRHWVVNGHRVFNRLATVRQPLVVAVHGLCLGGGLELALCGDFIIASDAASFGSPEVKIGTLPGWGGIARLPAAVGMARAKQMIYGGEVIGAMLARDWGLINEVTPTADLEQRVQEIAEQIASNAPVAVQLTKSILQSGTSLSGSSALEAIAGALAATTNDGTEGIAAFRQKRSPEFGGV